MKKKKGKEKHEKKLKVINSNPYCLFCALIKKKVKYKKLLLLPYLGNSHSLLFPEHLPYTHTMINIVTKYILLIRLR